MISTWARAVGFLCRNRRTVCLLPIPSGLRRLITPCACRGISWFWVAGRGRVGNKTVAKSSTDLNCARMICRRTWWQAVMWIPRRAGNRRKNPTWPSGHCCRCSKIPLLLHRGSPPRGPRCKKISARSIKISPGLILWSRLNCARVLERKIKLRRHLFLAERW